MSFIKPRNGLRGVEGGGGEGRLKEVKGGGSEGRGNDGNEEMRGSE